MISNGLNGIEVFYPNTPIDKIEYMKKFCDKNNLIVTGGSDFHCHDLTKKAFNLGTGYNNDICVPYSLLSNFKKT